MSMFHELMMRKKEQIMYATIKGTLTESPEGVFSGFSSSNYLETQSLSVSVTNWELVLNIKSNTQTAFLETKNRDILIRQYSATQVVIFMSSQGNITYDIANGLLVPLTISSNAWLKISFTGSSYVFSVSYDGINYEVKQTISSSSQIQNLFNSNYIKLGYSSFIGSAYNGVINLNRSSITIGSTKYKLQAVVGYTIVGSPTIVDGVVSGFNAYPNTPAYIYINKVISSLDSLELNLDFTTSAIVSSAQALLSHINSSAKGFLITFTSTRTVRISVYGVSDESSSTNKDFVANTSYILKILFKNNNLIVQIFEKQTNEKIFEYTKTSITLENLSFAYGVSIADTAYTKFQGSIDLNETYIKIDNKLWFNGQQA